MFTFTYRALVNNLPLNILNLILLPALLYYAHNQSPKLVLFVLLLSLFANNVANILIDYRKRLIKEITGHTDVEIVQAVLNQVKKEIADEKREADL
jgi:hypothetical protein